jgi:UDP-N-acetylglucosamine 2-epimerase (non-hydrolysing)
LAAILRTGVGRTGPIPREVTAHRVREEFIVRLSRVIVVAGARPNFIKIGPLMPALAAAGIDAGIAHTGQHYDARMSDVFFTDLAIPEPRWSLGIGSGTHAVQTGAAMVRLEELFAAESPDAVIVVGDVNSTLAGALAAVKIGIPVVHLEAGLRSWDMSMPEEVNRLVTDQVSSMLLTPTRDALQNLAREGVADARCHFVGNIMAESVLRNLALARAREARAEYGLDAKGYVLATIHRPENTDVPGVLAEIVASLSASPVPVLFPVHPRTAATLSGAGMREGGSLRPIEPVGYLDMLSLQCDAAVVVTDSGGLQEESCVVGTPCLTVRRNTERQITIEAGSNRLVAATQQAITSALAEALDSKRHWRVPEGWDTGVTSRIVTALESGILPLAGR